MIDDGDELITPPDGETDRETDRAPLDGDVGGAVAVAVVEGEGGC